MVASSSLFLQQAWQAARGAAARRAAQQASSPPLSALFSEPEPAAAADWGEQLRLALFAFAVLLVGQAANTVLGAPASALRRRLLARARKTAFPPRPRAARVRDWEGESGAAAEAAAAWAPVLSALDGPWELDAGASDGLGPLYDLLGYDWEERRAADSLTRLSFAPSDHSLRLRCESAADEPAVSFDEQYWLDGAVCELPSRHAAGAGEEAVARAARRDGGLLLTHAHGGGGGLREWYGAARAPDGREALVRETRVALEGGGRWEGVQVYRRPAAWAGPTGPSPSAAPESDLGPIGDDVGAWRPPTPSEEVEAASQAAAAAAAAAAALEAPPAPLQYFADMLLDSLPSLFGVRSARPATESELQLLASVERGRAAAAAAGGGEEAALVGGLLAAEAAEAAARELAAQRGLTGERARLAQWLSSRQGR